MADINPTQLTPPRVALIDERSGAISREWYRFFLSLRTAVQTTEDETVIVPDANSLSATLDEKIELQAQAAQSAPDAAAAIAWLDAKIDELAQALEAAPRNELGTMAALQQSNVPWLTFDTAPEVVPTDIGGLYWDGGTTLGVQMTADVLGRVNEDLFYYIKASGTITKGQVIMFDGAVGSSGVVKGKPATGVTDGSYIMGIAAESIALNGFGLVQFDGILKGIDTSAFADGDILWYNPAVAGGLTQTKPSAPNVKVQMAAVIKAGSGGSGSIVIRVDSGSVLGGTDSNVQFGTLSNGDLIQYDSALQYWKNISVLGAGNGGTGQSSYTTGDLLYASGASALSKLADVATGNVLLSGGVGTAPAYGKVGLTTHITGTLGVGNGGTGATTLTANALLKGNGTSAVSASNISDDGSTVSIASGKGFSVARTAVTSPAAADGNVFSGTYTPTLTNTTNITSSTPAVCQYMRVGNVVTVSGRVDITATTTGSSVTLGISLPIASTFTTNAQCAGTAAYATTTVANNAVARISGDTTNNRATFNANATVNTSASWYFSFTYQVI